MPKPLLPSYTRDTDHKGNLLDNATMVQFAPHQFVNAALKRKVLRK
jgi:hypothetical protein